jgi:hypothetical protein
VTAQELLTSTITNCGKRGSPCKVIPMQPHKAKSDSGLALDSFLIKFYFKVKFLVPARKFCTADIRGTH